MVRRLIITCVAVVAGVACGSGVQPINLHDETIPIEARRLVADAEDSIEIAWADLEEARRDLRQTREWRRDLLDRDWPSEASSAIQKLETMASARVRLEELKVERAQQRVEVAEAKFDLITAKTAIRHDLAIYELEPLRKRLRREEYDVKELDGKITAHRERLAQQVDEWWDGYKGYADQGGNTRLLYVSAAEKLAKRTLRQPSEEEQEDEGDADETEATPDLSEMVDEELDDELGEDDEASESDGDGEAGETESAD